MPTNEERRNVAKCLRGNPKDTIIPHKNGRNHGMGCHEAADRFWDICDRIKEAGKYDIAFSSTGVLADLIDPEPEPTFDEWLKDVKETCFANMEGCDEPEWSLFSTINDAIGLYLSGKSGYECRMIDYSIIYRGACSIEYDTVHLDYRCSECGEVFETGTYNSVNDDDEAFFKEFNHCPNCGRKVVKE